MTCKWNFALSIGDNNFIIFDWILRTFGRDCFVVSKYLFS